MSERLTQAIAIARKAHEGQVDRQGQPYIDHVLRVMSAGKNETEMIVGVLHDLIENTSWTIEALRAEGFREEILVAVEVLTGREDEPYEAYIERVAINPLAVQVKLHDLTDNMDVRRLTRLEKEETKRLRRYLKAWRKLTGRSGGSTYSLDKIRKEYANAYMPWRPEDDDQLEALYCEQTSVAELAKLFERKPGAIRSRIEKLGLEAKYR